MDSTKKRKRRALTSERIDRTMPASVIVDKFGGLSRFCELTGFATSTVHAWVERGFIPSHRQPYILQIAADNRIKIKPADFVHQPVAA